jgi:UMF1 family MFS transporter
MIITSLISPPLSAIADRTGVRKKLLLSFASLSIIATALLTTVQGGMAALGMIFFIAGTIGFEGSLIFYNAFLPDISTPTTVGRVSGWGWGLGYFGGLLCLFLVKPLVAGGFSPENLPLFRASFGAVAIFYAVFTLPAVFWLRESRPAWERNESARPSPDIAFSFFQTIGEAFLSLRDTFLELRRRNGALRFLLAFFLYNDGVVTVISFSSIYAVSTLGFSMTEALQMFIAVQVSAGVGALALGYLSDVWGERKTVLLTLVNWCLVVVIAYLTHAKSTFFLVAILAGLSLGSCQSASRALMARYVPPGGSTQTYAFYGLCGKMSSILGPLVFGGVSAVTGDQRVAILSVLLFFLVGGALLWSTPEPEDIPHH